MDVNCNSKLKQFFKNIMFIEVDICKSPQYNGIVI